ncbi:HAD family hydrolase [Brachybacterium sp. DNPG3]
MSIEISPLPPSPLDLWPPAWTPSAVVFDCDGLLVDTEARWVELQDAYLERHGARLDEATRRSITGRAAEVVVEVIGEAVGKHPLTVRDDLLAAFREGYEEDPVPMPGAVETLRAIAAKRPVAVASNSPREMLDEKLATLGVADLVDATIAVEDVLAPKPAPDMYLAGARALGADPADCLGFEDSETGAQAALGAGLQLIVVPSVPGQSPRAPRVLASLEDPQLAAWIAGWESTR